MLAMIWVAYVLFSAYTLFEGLGVKHFSENDGSGACYLVGRKQFLFTLIVVVEQSSLGSYTFGCLYGWIFMDSKLYTAQSIYHFCNSLRYCVNYVGG